MEKDIANSFALVFEVLNLQLHSKVYSATLRGAGNPFELPAIEARHVNTMTSRRAQEFAAGRTCARAALANLGIRDQAVDRRPDRTPVWPPGIVGSLSHTGDWSLAAVARATELVGIGVDIEEVGRIRPKIWPTIFRESELDYIKTEVGAYREVLPSVIFSAKEAYFKFQWPVWAEWLDFTDVEVEIKSTDSLMVKCCKRAGLPPSASGLFAFDERFVCVCVYQEQ